MPRVLYVYAIASRGALAPPELGGVDGQTGLRVVESGDLAALVSEVDSEEFSQETIDSRAGDLDWLGSIGYRHQQVVEHACRESDVIPLRAFVLFSNDEALARHLEEKASELRAILGTIAGREEWTVKLEFDEEEWGRSIERRSPSLATLAAEAEGAPAGKAYLLRRKMDEARKNAAREAIEGIATEIEERITRELGAPVVAELSRTGSMPQFNVLLERSRGGEIETLTEQLLDEYRGEGIHPMLTGPWPPYTFVTRSEA
ncbi:MAG: GvpL/GvpF family gas vesicle protein [Thermoanaerobaculia bacterium]